MVPEVAELAFVLAGNKEGRPREPLPPLLSAQPTHLRQAEMLAFVDGLALAELDLADPVGLRGIATVAHVLDEERPGTGYGQQHLARPLVRDVRGAHHQRRCWLPFG